MKKILILICLMFLFVSCNLENEINNGNIVYIKPDSTKAVVTATYGQTGLRIAYIDDNGVRHYLTIGTCEIY